MFSYIPPLKDMQFVLNNVLEAPTILSGYPAFKEIDSKLMDQVIEEAGRFASDILFPLNASGDREGCRFDNGKVSTPQGFSEAYLQFREAGWSTLACSTEHDGQGLPQILNCVLYEMMSASNHGWTMYPGLIHGAYACLSLHASKELKSVYLPKIVSGEWLPTMCLTESQAGTDLGLLRTKAIPASADSFAISGSKIFISGGEHDMTENIVHLVLARLPDAPSGSKGVSLFLVPKFLPGESGLGARNNVYCTGIEHKMGIRGSATCSMQFDQAIGWLIGEPHRGLAAMFIMMNAARLQVGAQGLGIAETAFQNSLAYSQERLQMKAIDRPASRKHEVADPIAMHPAVKRLLMTQRAYVEGGRMLAYWTGLMLDGAENHPSLDIRETLHGQVSLITPIVKAMLTEQGFQGASQALQIFGGHGFISETGIEQYVRDARVTMIYEGTNEIQAIDLLVRKVLADNGSRLNVFLMQVEQTARDEEKDEFVQYAESLTKLVQNIRKTILSIAQEAIEHPSLPFRIAPEMLRLIGHCALSWLWLRAARSAHKIKLQDPEFCSEKLDTASYYFTFVLPETLQLLGVINAGLSAES